MSFYSTADRELARIAGFDVLEDVDQPTLYVWVRLANGHVVEGCDCSFPDPDSAWDEAIAQTFENAMADADVSDEEWDGMDQEKRLALVRESFPSGPVNLKPLDANMA